MDSSESSHPPIYPFNAIIELPEILLATNGSDLSQLKSVLVLFPTTPEEPRFYSVLDAETIVPGSGKLSTLEKKGLYVIIKKNEIEV